MCNVFLGFLRKCDLALFIAAICAISLQIHSTLFVNEGYLGLRVGLADVFLPVFGVIILFSLLVKKSSLFPKWSVPHVVGWLIALVIVMSFSLFNGYVVNGALAHWALLNKYFGFFILLAYFFLGSWVVSNTANWERCLEVFVNAFVCFFVFTLLVSVMTLFVGGYHGEEYALALYPWDAFMGNRNAWMIVYIMACSFVVYFGHGANRIIPVPILVLFWLMLPIFLVFNGSRTGWIMSGILVAVYLSKDPVSKLKFSVPLLLLGVGLLFASFNMTKSQDVLKSKHVKHFVYVVSGKDLRYEGDKKRYIAFEDATELYLSYNSLVGAGLGSYRPFQEEKRGKFVEIIDCTPLWLIAEMGLVGLLVFSCYFLVCLSGIYKRGFDGNTSSFHRALFLFMLLFIGATILHELMYTRLLWFLVGMGLSVSRKESPSVSP